MRRVFCLLTIVAAWPCAPNLLTSSIEIMCLHFISFLFSFFCGGQTLDTKVFAKRPQVVALKIQPPGAYSSDRTQIYTRGRTSPPAGVPFPVFGKPSFFIVSHVSILH